MGGVERETHTHTLGVCVFKAHVTPSRVSTALAQSSLNFQSALRSQANLHIFRGKGSITASLRRPYSDHGIAIKLAWRSIAFLRSARGNILCALTTPSLRFHRDACTALSRRPHCADGVLKTQCMNFPTFPKFWKKIFVPSKFEYIYYVQMNKISIPNNKLPV